ncbi:hypothetical protein bcCo53_001571 (plasmid) [Borrelia coriaceae]|nr:CRASP family complement regulator-acquiring lipoprotein [Borrelia coriaceae]UPA17375.1 hypothetical protein bcCo53_001571 [Borrelia coriaceae]
MKRYLFVLSIVSLLLISCDFNGHKNDISKVDKGYISKIVKVKKSKNDVVTGKGKKEISLYEVVFNLRLEIVNLIAREIDKISFSELKIMREPRDFYGLPFSYIISRDGKFVLVCPDPKCAKIYRRRFYISLDYNENRLKKLGMFFAKISLDSVINLLNCIFSVVSCAYQLKLESLIENMNLKRNILMTMSIKDLNYIKSNLEWILSLREAWNDRINELINFINGNFKGTEFMLEEFNHFINQRFKFLMGEMEKVGILVDVLLKLII